MFCKGCRNPLPKKAENLKYCVYCGRPVRRVPTWVKATSTLASLGAIALLVYFFLPCRPSAIMGHKKGL